MRLRSIHYFRGTAILFIVAGHCIGVSGWYFGSPLRKLIANLLYGGSPFFIFISGFLFHHVYYKKFDYRNFLLKKLRYVLSPYLVLSTLMLLYYAIIDRQGPHLAPFPSVGGGISGYIRPITVCLVTGATSFGYWYVPFIMIIFAMSPLLIRYVDLRLPVKIVILCSLYVVASLMHRPVNNIFVLQSVMYFMPVYLLGIDASIYKEVIYKRSAGKEIYLLLGGLVLALTQVVFYDNFLNFHKEPFTITVLDINLFQKTFFCFFFMVWLHRFEEVELPFVGALADASFAIYFLHPIIILALLALMTYTFHGHSMTIIYKILVFPMVVAASYLLASLLKKILRSRSRYIIGS